MRKKRKYEVKKNTELANKTLEEKLQIFANLIIDRIMEDQQKGIVHPGGGDNGIQR